MYEYVDVRALYKGILRHVVPRRARGFGGPALDSPAGPDPMHGENPQVISMLVALIGVTGTDFTRGLPLVSGKTVYEMIPELWAGLARAYDPSRQGLDPDVAPDALFARIYALKFATHVTPGSFAAVSGQIARSKLGERTKAAIPPEQALACNARNINWLLAYWRQLSFPDPLQPQFGYTLRRGVVCHAD